MRSGITVVVPVHDGERYLAETLASIAAQTVPAGEILVVDDASTDGSAEIATRLGARVERVEVRDPDRARAMGVELAANELIAFCDADDLWLPHKLECHLAAVAHLDVDGLFVAWTAFDEFVSPDVGVEEYCGRVPQLASQARLVSTLMTTRATCRAGEPSLGSCGSWIEWIAGLPPTVTDVRVDEVLMRRRLHLTNHSSMTRSLPQSQAWLRAARLATQRRRQEST
jgi:hypothetical protein